jgi:HEAT repeat protein
MVDQTAALEAAGVDALVDWLREADATSCERAGQALMTLSQSWKARHPLQDTLAARIDDQFNRFSPAGRVHAIRVLECVVDVHAEELPSETTVQALRNVLVHGDGFLGNELRSHALHFALHSRPLIPPAATDWLDVCRLLVKSGLTDDRVECRAAAVRLAATPGVDMLDKVVPLLIGETKDPATEVRVVSILMLGSSDHEELLGTDEMLPLLHETDAEVRRVAERALRGRGLQGSRLHLAKLVSHPEATQRAQAALAVFRFPELDSVLWLDRLSRDEDPAVRAAALRAASQFGEERFRSRVTEMATKDPSPTVRQIASYYSRASRPGP